VVLHDIINNKFAHKAIEKGADGLIAVAAGAGGHAGVKSPFALVQEIRQWFDGPLALSGSIANGASVLAAQAMGADFAYMGTAFIATHEARAVDAYKQAIVEGSSDDIVYSNLFTGVHGNYLAPSIRAAGLDPEQLPESDPSKMNFGGDAKKAWKDIWGSGQGIGAITRVQSTADYVAQLRREYRAARSACWRFRPGSEPAGASEPVHGFAGVAQAPCRDGMQGEKRSRADARRGFATPQTARQSACPSGWDEIGRFAHQIPCMGMSPCGVILAGNSSRLRPNATPAKP